MEFKSGNRCFELSSRNTAAQFQRKPYAQEWQTLSQHACLVDHTSAHSKGNAKSVSQDLDSRLKRERGEGEREEKKIFLIERVLKTFPDHEQPIPEPTKEVDRKGVCVPLCGVCVVFDVCAVYMVISEYIMSVVPVVCLMCGT